MVVTGQNKSLSVLIVMCLCIMAPALLTAETDPSDHSAGNVRIPQIHEFDFPDSIRLCGEVIDLTDPKNSEMFDREFTISVWDIPQVFMWMKRTTRFFPYFEERLAEAGLPEDLKYLAVAESSLHTHIKSKAGALGIWQLMDHTARRYGLTVDRAMMDERLCFDRSTDAAIKYLKDLKETFHAWLLAMAAYNCGENQLNKALKNQNGTDYFNLDLPRETERYVYRIAAIKLILENPEYYGFHVDESRRYKPLSFERINVHIKDRIYISDLTELLDIPYKNFKELNPKITSPLLPLGTYQLHIQNGYEDRFFAAVEKLKDPAYRKKHSYDKRYYVVQPGDVLSSIAWETGVSVRTIKKLNRLRGSVIRPGQKLLIRK